MEISSNFRTQELTDNYLKNMGINRQQVEILSQQLHPVDRYRLSGVTREKVEELILTAEIDGGTAGNRVYLSKLGAKMLPTKIPEATARYIVHAGGAA